MSILDSAIAPYLTLLVIIAVLAGFFRKSLIHTLITLAVIIVLLALFPVLLEKFIQIIRFVRGIFL